MESEREMPDVEMEEDQSSEAENFKQKIWNREREELQSPPQEDISDIVIHNEYDPERDSKYATERM